MTTQIELVAKGSIPHLLVVGAFAIGMTPICIDSDTAVHSRHIPWHWGSLCHNHSSRDLGYTRQCM